MDNYNKEKDYINNCLKNFILKFEDKTLKELLNHAFNNGKRLRPVIAKLIVDNNNKNFNKNIILDNLYLIIEIYHTCSLIIDDLPYMDNDLFRRGQKTLHHKYGVPICHIIVDFLLKETIRLLIENINIIKKNKVYPEEYIDNITILI